jgi:hypothetical protein
MLKRSVKKITIPKCTKQILWLIHVFQIFVCLLLLMSLDNLVSTLYPNANIHAYKTLAFWHQLLVHPLVYNFHNNELINSTFSLLKPSLCKCFVSQLIIATQRAFCWALGTTAISNTHIIHCQ